MTVTFETVAKFAPAGLAFQVWVSIPDSQQTSGIPITWSDDTNGQATWQATTTNLGDDYSYLASGVITVPLSYIGATGKDVKITADAGAHGTKDYTIAFQDWGTTPRLGDVTSNNLVVFPKDLPSTNGIIYQASVAKTDKTLVKSGAEVQWFVSPRNGVATFYDAATNAKLPLVRGGYWAAVNTDANGYSSVNVTANKTLAITMQAQSPVQSMFSTSDTAYYIDPEDPTVPQKFRSPTVDDVTDGLFNVTGQITFTENLPSISATYANKNYTAFLYFDGNGQDVPWSAGDASVLQSPLTVDVPVADVNIDATNVEGNQTLFFVQATSGSIFKSGGYAFGGQGTANNRPDPTIPSSARPFYAPSPNPDVGIGGFITDDTLKNHIPAGTYPDGLMLQYGRSLGAGYAAGSGKVVFNFYMNGVDKDQQQKPRLWTVDAVEPLDPATRFYHAVLDYNKAAGYFANSQGQYGLFWAEMAFVPTNQDSNRSAWTYSQYNSYILATGVG
ncbi:hypothetical protein [Pseudorhodoplanes sinuspersici]|uniref:Uncharacterized protein n=1 Tax=Pseudorhodoplanes sinuspersici TaxID=1235591 RepID=A0A1W6ZYE5_9HYPH|nr:hypothetical protein [Pseudorhodoplanes sinuspersici]ARQ02333.1 hypothetical protein CAK95_26935 [Pseudorhodoplanes sinuspersici]RKE74160.1 hypothetical protein DFP91_2063 [Pseudorhodoplanes sinuspersici]